MPRYDIVLLLEDCKDGTCFSSALDLHGRDVSRCTHCEARIALSDYTKSLKTCFRLRFMYTVVVCQNYP